MSAAGGVLERLIELARRHGERQALAERRGRGLRCAELVDEAARLGAGLARLGAGPEGVVGLALGRSSEHVLGCLAAWWAGAAFVPLDLAWPDERLAFVLDEARPVAVLTTPDQVPRLARLGARSCVPGDLKGEAAEPCDFDPDRLAFLIYTSGSTGRPKGVEVTHRGLVNLLESQIEAFGLGAASRVLWLLSPVFDASVSDLGTSLLAGATLVIAAQEELRDLEHLVQLLHDEGITHLDLPPALLRLLDPGRMPESLQTLIVGGEASPCEVLRRWARRFRVVNVYGPTEATVCTSLCVCDAETWHEPLLGRPLPGVRYLVLDEHGQPVPPGGTGELCIGGTCLARGYKNRPELTASRFIERDGERLYRTGDRVRWREDGEYVFLGRLDRQVKVRGLLVAPEEIEARVLEQPGVREAAVVKRPLGDGGQEGLAAFVAASAGLDAGEIRRHLARSLPDWMVPQRIVLVARLPRTSTGKVDLGRLESEPLPGAAEGCATGTLGVIVQTCRRVLGTAVDPDAGFLEQGGDSLTLLQVVAALGARGLVVAPGLLREGHSLRDVAAGLEKGLGVREGLPADWLRRDVEALLGEGPLPRPVGELPPRDRPGTILLTGATGFLGSHVLVELLRQTEAEIVCLVRAAGARAGHERLAQALARQGLSLRTQERRRLGIVAGDLGQPRLGLAPPTWDELARRVEAIYHAAAQVNLVRSYEDLRGDNVLGTYEVLRLWAAGRARWLHHVSTLSVFVATDRNRGSLAESDDLSATGRVHGGYAQSKWAAEWLVRRACGGRGVTHFRPGLVTPDERSGRCPASDFLTLFLRGVARLGCLPACDRSALWLDVAPVDFVARALVHLSLHAPPALGDTFHLPGGRSVSLAELVAALQRAGVQIEEVDAACWRERLAGLQASDAGAACLALCRAFPGEDDFECYRTMDLFQATGVQFGTERARAGLAGSGIRWPAADEALLDRYVAGVSRGGA